MSYINENIHIFGDISSGTKYPLIYEVMTYLNGSLWTILVELNCFIRFEMDTIKFI